MTGFMKGLLIKCMQENYLGMIPKQFLLICLLDENVLSTYYCGQFLVLNESLLKNFFHFVVSCK